MGTIAPVRRCGGSAWIDSARTSIQPGELSPSSTQRLAALGYPLVHEARRTVGNLVGCLRSGSPGGWILLPRQASTSTPLARRTDDQSKPDRVMLLLCMGRARSAQACGRAQMRTFAFGLVLMGDGDDLMSCHSRVWSRGCVHRVRLTNYPMSHHLCVCVACGCGCVSSASHHTIAISYLF